MARNHKLVNLLVLGTLAIAVIAALAGHYSSLPHAVVFITRWLFAAALLLYAVQKKSLTTWILVSTVIGGIFGYDFPHAAVRGQVLSQIFLRLIKTIIAPLIFSTLVVGIAGHSNLKQVGRMGLKSLIYFEVVTTLALFIGLAAINISKAGVGARMTSASTGQLAATTRPTASDVILHIFPENIAK